MASMSIAGWKLIVYSRDPQGSPDAMLDQYSNSPIRLSEATEKDIKEKSCLI